ncbi:MAG: Alpha-mannosidase [Herbinix sp.]|jgi:alpha-mannosidase|nr:Alpha-mannosidase [Herbinix sp.]
MNYAKERIRIITDQLMEFSKLQRAKILDWKVKEGCFIDVAEVDASEENWRTFDTEKELWYGPDKHYWFRTEVTIPKEFDQKPLWLRVRSQLEHGDDGRNPQFLAFVNGAVIQGIDINHKEIFLMDKATAGETFQLDLQSYTGTLHKEFRLLVELEEIHSEVYGLYYDLAVPLWALNRMDQNDKTRWEIETILNHTINMIDLRKPHSLEFYTSVTEARAYIQKALYEELTGFDDIIASCIGHTHIDVAWLWTVDQVRQKVSRSFATVLKLMEEYPSYKFMSSQPQLYKFLKERHPEVYDKIKERVKEGRWETEGGMWVEADCNLTSGESLVRQFLFGERFFQEEFGVNNRILWLPDVFGYSGALPQIMKKSGIDYFMTTKLAWNQFNKIPFDTFYWEGIDGSRVFTHFITTTGVGQPSDSYFTTYNGMLHPDSIMGGWERYQNKEINNDILISFGYGDGGGGPTRKMLETSKRMEKGIKGVPKVRQVSSRTYFEELEERVKNKKIPRWVGELYFEYHRGTYTSMARNKRSNRKSEYLMMDLELLSVLAMAKGIPYPTRELNEMWEIVLRNQFHDILPGSSIKEVYDVTKVEYEEITKKAEALIKERMEALSGAEDGITVFNTLGYLRDDVVVLGDIEADAVTDGNRIYPIQQTEDGAIAYITGMPSKGYITLDKCHAETESSFRITDLGVETPFYRITWNEYVQFTSIYDKENNREVLKAGELGNVFRIYEDKPMCFSNWDIDIYYQEKSWQLNDIISMEWTEKGPVRAALLVKRSCMDTVISQVIYFYGNTRRIDFKTYVDWKFSEHLMKVHFPVDVHTDEAVFDIQFGNVTRKIHQNTSWDVARFETCGHKWVDLSEGDYGVSLLNDCKYGHSIEDGNIALTLIKSGTEPNRTTDQEEHYFTYALYPHSGTWKEGKTAEAAMNLNVPARAMLKGVNNNFSFLSTDKENVVLETVKCSEDGEGIIIRLYEIQNKRSYVTVTVDGSYSDVIETNLMEKPEKAQAIERSENGFCFEIKPYEIKTFKLIQNKDR